LIDPRIEQAAEILGEARGSRQKIACLPQDCRPRSLEEAYAIQDAACARLGAVGGWKVGAKSPTGDPSCAPIAADLIVTPEQGLAFGSHHPVELEGEIAFVLARDLPERSSPYTADEAAAAIASVHTAIEVLDSRFIDRRSVDQLCVLADMLSNAALVVGKGQPAGRRVDSAVERAQVFVSGEIAADMVGANPAGDLYRLLAWLANHAATRFGGLRAGQVVTTGTCSGVVSASPPVRVLARIGQFDEVATWIR